MKRLTRTGYVIAGATATAVLVGGGAAFAYWTSSGTGTGSAAAGTTTNVTIAQVGTAITGLYPNGPVEDIDIEIANPDASDVEIGAITTAVSSITGAGAGGCTAADFAVVSLYAGGTIPGGQTVAAPVAATIQMINRPLVNQDGCKGVTVNLSFTAS
jgi:hypothetical protein